VINNLFAFSSSKTLVLIIAKNALNMQSVHMRLLAYLYDQSFLPTIRKLDYFMKRETEMHLILNVDLKSSVSFHHNGS
jgi:hypothetical protein